MDRNPLELPARERVRLARTSADPDVLLMLAADTKSYVVLDALAANPALPAAAMGVLAVNGARRSVLAKLLNRRDVPGEVLADWVQAAIAKLDSWLLLALAADSRVTTHQAECLLRAMLHVRVPCGSAHALQRVRERTDIDAHLHLEFDAHTRGRISVV